MNIRYTQTLSFLVKSPVCPTCRQLWAAWHQLHPRCRFQGYAWLTKLAISFRGRAIEHGPTQTTMICAIEKVTRVTNYDSQIRIQKRNSASHKLAVWKITQTHKKKARGQDTAAEPNKLQKPCGKIQKFYHPEITGQQSGTAGANGAHCPLLPVRQRCVLPNHRFQTFWVRPCGQFDHKVNFLFCW